jgi:hypothetical protein
MVRFCTRYCVSGRYCMAFKVNSTINLVQSFHHWYIKFLVNNSYSNSQCSLNSYFNSGTTPGLKHKNKAGLKGRKKNGEKHKTTKTTKTITTSNGEMQTSTTTLMTAYSKTLYDKRDEPKFLNF